MHFQILQFENETSFWKIKKIIFLVQKYLKDWKFTNFFLNANSAFLYIGWFYILLIQQKHIRWRKWLTHRKEASQ
jgi:hypothetical protein